MVTPITMQKAMRILNGSVTLTASEIFILYVNSQLSSQTTMERHRCAANMGHFYHVCLDIKATPAECLAIEAAFKPGWKAVKVVYWEGRLSIHLDCHKNPALVSYYNGAPLINCVDVAEALTT